MTKNEKTPEQVVYRVSTVTLILNLFLSVGKLVAGLVGSSGAMVADAVHSASDAFTTVLVMVGAKISASPADADHPYGHERLECLISLALSLILFFVGVGIGWDGIRSLVSGETPEAPSVIALIAAAVSIVVKEGMYRYTVRNAKRINSLSLKADAWHHRSDALSSIGSMAGIGGAMLGFLWADALAAAIISVLILKVAYDICFDTVGRLVDHAAPKELEERVRAAAVGVENVHRIDLLRSRLFGTRVYVDLEIAVDGDLTLRESHAIAEAVRDAVCAQVSEVKTCTVHVNPD